MVWNLVAGRCQSVTPKKSFATFVKPIITLLLAPKIKMRETFWTAAHCSSWSNKK